MKITCYRLTYLFFSGLLLIIFGSLEFSSRANASVGDKHRLGSHADALLSNAIYVGSLAIINEIQEVRSTSLAEERTLQKESVREITVSGSSLEACKKAMAEVIKSNKKVVELSQCEKQDLELGAVNNFFTSI